MGQVYVPQLHNICVEVLIKLEVPYDDAVIIADSIIYAHKREKHTHGLGRMPIYARKIKQNLLNPYTPISITDKTPVISIIDANNGFGQIAGVRAMDFAVERSKKYGISLVGVRNSNNFGTAGYIAEQAFKAGMIGIVMSNSAPAIAPTNGKKALFGTNPICIAFPAINDEFPIVFDMASSNIARGKVRLAAKRGEKIPIGWAADENGNETDDPNEALKGFMLPIGGHKGYGISLCVDILAGLMTGSGFGGNVKNLDHPTDSSKYGHMIMSINPDCFISKEEYKFKIKYLIEQIKGCGEPGSIYLPGEQSFKKAIQNAKFIDLNQNMIDEFNKLTEALINKKIKEYCNNETPSIQSDI